VTLSESHSTLPLDRRPVTAEPLPALFADQRSGAKWFGVGLGIFRSFYALKEGKWRSIGLLHLRAQWSR
jgi:hypothetical protein